MKANKRKRAPDVILDFVFEGGLFFVDLENIGEKPALKVRVAFDQRIMGVGGTQEISALALFRDLEFLAPHKRIRCFLDTSREYFSRGEPLRITAKIVYKDSEGAAYRATIRHNLSVYQELGYVQRMEIHEDSR